MQKHILFSLLNNKKISTLLLKNYVYFTIPHIMPLQSVGAVFVLMTNRTKEIYNAVFLKLQEFCPNLKNNLRHIMTDFEIAVISSVRESFPNCSHHGCWFHSKKVIVI